MDATALPASLRALEGAMQAAEDLLRAGRHRDALVAYMRLLDRRQAERLDTGRAARSADLLLIERTAELASMCALVDAADDLLLAMAQFCRSEGNDQAADYAQLKRAEVLIGHDRVRAAFDVLATLAPRIGDVQEIQIDPDGLAAWEGCIAWRLLSPEDRSVLLTRAYVLMGRLLLALGRYGDGLQMIARGLVYAGGDAAPDLSRRALPVLQLLRARALLERGELDAARAALEAAAQEDANALGIALRLQRLGLDGKLAMLQGRFGAAARGFREQVDHCRRAGLRHAGVVAGLNLAHVLVLLNRVGEAIARVDEARDIARSLDDRALERRCDLVAQVATARRSSGQEAMAVTLSVREMAEGRSLRRGGVGAARPRHLALGLESADHLAHFEECALAYQWQLGSDAAEAARELADLETVFAQSESRLIRARLPALAGLLAMVCGRHAEAQGRFKAAAQAHEALGTLPECWQALHLQARSLQALDRLGEAGRCAERAAALLDSLAGALEGGDRAIYLLNKSTAEEQLIEARVDRLAAHAALARTGGWARQLSSRMAMLRQMRQLVRQLDTHRADLANHHVNGDSDSGVPTRWPAIRWRLPARDQATLVFIVLADRVVVVWSTFLRDGFAISPVTRVDLREEVRRWHEHTQQTLTDIRAGWPTPDALAAREAGDATLLERLGRMLQLEQVIDALPKRVTRLTVVADDVLHGLPFAALRVQGRHLIKRFSISMAFESRPARVPVAERRVADGLVVGVGKIEGQTALSAVGEECDGVCTWLRAQGLVASTLRDDDATRARVLRHWSQASFLHIACHGTFEPDRPDLSGLLLAGQDDADRRLTIRELSGLSLQHCRHVTLSACSSADNFVTPGRWVISLPEVLRRSGAQSVLGSLWPVADEVASLFMQRFYSALSRLPRDAALREAQLSLIAGIDLPPALAGAPLHAPCFWAGYVLHGEPGRLAWHRPAR
jgi:CHAT domain-containing protein/tetratricopeptide (TPR) repeat protein